MFKRIAERPFRMSDATGGSAPQTVITHQPAASDMNQREWIERRVEELLARKFKEGEAEQKIAALEASLKREREKIGALEQKQIPDGAVVLQGDDAHRWQAYTALGTPDDLKQGLQQRDADAQELAKLRTKEAVRTAADIYDWKDDVLYDLLAPRGLVPTTKEEKQGDQIVKQAFVKDGDRDVPLDTFVARFLPALQREASQQQAPTQRQGARVIEQHHGGSGQPASPTRAFIEQRNAAEAQRPNPLLQGSHHGTNGARS